MLLAFSHESCALYSANAVAQCLLDLSMDEQQLTGKQTTWAHSLAGTSAQRCSNAHAMPALLCFQQPSSSFRPLMENGIPLTPSPLSITPTSHTYFLQL
jgi:hypothetical protein